MTSKQDDYISKFKPLSHFFTDPGALAQSAAQAFGPVSANEFKLTSNFTVAGSGAKAFAICKGVVLVQPQTGNDGLVNLILRPYTQPIMGFNIQYFIYRGLNKSDFFNGVKVLAAGANTSDFINKVNASFQNFYHDADSEAPLPDFFAKFIGYDPAKQADNLMLADFFFKESEYVDSHGEFIEKEEEAFELPMIAMGASLGNFSSGECGIDIVLNYGDYKLPQPNSEFVFDLAYARQHEAKIEISDSLTEFAKKLKREQIFQFLDAAAYFGFHSKEGGIVTLNNSGTKVDKKGVDIYNDVLSSFYTKNKIYIYIQSDRTRSYNFYGNYKISDSNSNSLKLGVTATALTERTYETSGWPLIIDDTPQANTDNRNRLFLQLLTDNNANAMLYGQVAQIDNARHNNFCDVDHLKLPDDVDGTPSVWTKAIALSNPAIGTDTAKLNIATFNILLYEGKTYTYVAGQVTDGQNVTTDVLATANFFDDVFDLINATPLIKAGSDTHYSTLSVQKVKLVNHYYDKKQYGISAVQTAIVNDVIDTGIQSSPNLSRVTYITESVDILNTAFALSGTVTNDTKSSPSGTVTNDTKSSPSVTGTITTNKTYILPEPFYYSLLVFTDTTQTISGLKLDTKDDTMSTKIVLGLSKTENDLLKDLIITNNLINPRLFLVDLFEDGKQFTSLENILYQKYKVGIVAENDSTDNLKLYLTNPQVIVYSLDRRYHFTKAYSENMPAYYALRTKELLLDVRL